MTLVAQPSIENTKPLRRSGVMVARGARGLLRLCLLLLFVFVIFVAVVTGGARVGLPFLAAYKPTLETRLSDYLQSPVTIKELDARWAGTGPELRARGVLLTDPLGRQAQFDELLIDVNVPRSILAAGPVMDELTLVGADLALNYDPDNGVVIHGVNRDTGIATPRTASAEKSVERKNGFNAVAWLLTASRVGMLDTQLRVQMPDDTTLQISNLNIRAENRGKLHQIRMDMSLPEELGDEFEIGADIEGDAERLSEAGGNFYVKAADFKAEGIHRLLSGYDVNLPILQALSDRGTNAQVELWGELDDGNVQRVNGRTAIAQTQKDDPTIDSLFGDLLWVRNETQGWQFAATDVVVGRRGAEAVFDEVRMGTQQKNSLKPEWVSLKTVETELQPVVNTITTLLPSTIPVSVSAWLASASPSAKIRQADLSISLQDPASSFSMDAQLEDMHWLPSGKQPGAQVGRLNVNIENGKGQLEFPTQAINVLPGTIAGGEEPSLPIVVDTIRWNALLNLPGKTLSGDLTLQQASVNAALWHSFDWVSADATTIDILGQFNAGDLTDVKPWLVQSWMPSGARRWYERALQSGEIRNGNLEISGLLSELTRRKSSDEKLNVATNVVTNERGRGESSRIRAEFDVRQAQLKFLSTWPAAEAVNGKVVFDQTRLRADITSGSLAGLPIAKATANIDDLFSPTLNASLTSETSLQSLVTFGVEGPLKRILSPVLAGAEVDGPARLEVNVSTPLRRPKPTSVDNKSRTPWPVTVDGRVFLQDSRVTLAGVNLPLTNVRGPIGFTEKGIELKTVTAKLYGSNVRINAASAGNGANRRTDIALRSVMPARKLLEQFQLPVAQFVSGSSSWRADASIPHNAKVLAQSGIALTVTSDLVGTSLALAKPLGKNSNAALPLKLFTRFNSSKATQSGASPQIWKLTFGDKAAPRVDMRISVANNTMQGMELSLGAPVTTTEVAPGIRVTGAVQEFSLDGIVGDVSALINAVPKRDGPPAKILPISVDLYGQQMSAGRTGIGDASIKVNTDDKFINVFINNAHLRGSVRYPREHWRNDIQAKARINFADKVLVDALSSGNTLENDREPTRLDPRTLPPFELHVSEFVWEKLRINDLRIRTEPDVAGLKVTTFGFATGKTQLIGEGLWHLIDPQNVNASLANKHYSQLHLTLQSSDFGNALSMFGFDGVMDDGEGRVTASLNWSDAFYVPSVKRIAARADLDIKRGRLLQIEPGAARFAGLFALQSIPRRFNLDFKDIVKDGLDFATITGDVAVESGLADMRLIQLNGPVGVVDVTGTSDLVSQEFDQTVTVLPRVSAALPIIGIISGGASAGIGALLAGGVLKAAGVDFDRLGLREYSLTGPWDAPQLEPIRR